MSWIIFLQFIPYFLVCKKFSFGNCNHHCCCRSFAATFWHKGCVAGARPRPHSILMLILFLFLLLLLPSSCVREFGFPFFFWLPFSASKPFTPLGCGGRMRRMEQGAGGLHSVSSPWATSKNIRPCLHRIQAAVYYYFLRPLLFPLLFAPFSPFSFY